MHGQNHTKTLMYVYEAYIKVTERILFSLR